MMKRRYSYLVVSLDEGAVIVVVVAIVTVPDRGHLTPEPRDPLTGTSDEHAWQQVTKRRQSRAIIVSDPHIDVTNTRATVM